jgi:phytanoyl-CoA hydroxylase
MTLTPAQIEQYHRDGYLVVRDVLTTQEVADFLDHERARGAPAPGGIRAHTVDPQWRALATHSNIAGIARQLLGGKPWVVQTMFLDKSPKGGKGIALHQDTHHLPNEPNTLMACWIAMTDTDGTNGGLCVVPGSHKLGLRSTHQSAANNANYDSWVIEHRMRDTTGREWNERMYSYEIDDLDESTVARLSVPKGAGVFFTGLTIHGSYANTSPDRPRKAWAVHYVRDGTWLFRCDVQETMAVA